MSAAQSYQVEQVSPTEKRIAFSIPQNEIADKLDKAFKEAGRNVRINGFRPGKVPRKVLEGRVGRKVRADVAQDIIEFNFRQAAQDLTFLGQPRVEAGEIKDDGDFQFSIFLQVRPEVELSEYKGLKVRFPIQAVAEEQIDARVEAQRKTMARLMDVEEDRDVQSGDLALCEIHKRDGDAETQLEAGVLVNTQGDRYYPGIESLILGMKKGEERSGSVTIGASQLPGIANQTVELRVKLHGIQTHSVPPLTDELAGSMGYEGGIEGMRAAIRMQEESRANEAARNLARIELLQKLNAAHNISVPAAMIESHTQLLMEELRIQNTYRGRDARSMRFTDAQIADLRQRGEFAARSAILLEAIAQREGIAVTDDDLEAKYQEIADARGQRIEAIRGYFVKENAVEELRTRLLQDRALEWLLEQAELETVEISASTEAAASEPAADAAAGESQES